MTSATITRILVSASRRDLILSFAAGLVHPDERQPDAVIAAAEPLLEWAASAADGEDQRARMHAMSHVNGNAPRYRQGYMTGIEVPARPTPEAFLAQARAYYQFLTA